MLLPLNAADTANFPVMHMLFELSYLVKSISIEQDAAGHDG